MTEFQQTRIAGIPLHMPGFAEALIWAEQRIRSGDGGYVCHVGAHGIVEAQQDECLRRALAGAALAVPDGVPLVWLGRMRGLSAERVYGPDFMRALLSATAQWADRPCRHFLFGSSPEVLARLRHHIGVTYPGAIISGSLSPPFRAPTEQEEQEHLRMIRAVAPDVVWVGMGAPRQEKWMARMSEHLPGTVLLGVGAAFDFLSGNKRQAPAWVGRAGLEWAYRWLTEPRRLSGRYARVVPMFLWLTARDGLRSRRED